MYNGIKEEYSLIKHLKAVSEIDSKYKNLYALWVLDQEAYSDSLLAIINTFPHFSMHDASHSLSIINKIEMILGEDRIRLLSPTDTFLILEAAFLHDFGMIVSDKEEEELWSSNEFQKYMDDVLKYNFDEDLVDAVNEIKSFRTSNKELTSKEDFNWAMKIKRSVILLNADYYRKKHNYRSYEMIKKSNYLNNFNYLIPSRFKRLIAQFALIHGMDFESIIENLDKEDNGIGTDIIHPRMIACLLRLGDLLDLDNNRFNKVLIETNHMPESSLKHNEKHQAITHFLVTPEKIELSAICPNQGVYNVTRQWVEWLKDEISNISSKWYDIFPDKSFGGAPNLGKVNLSIEDNNEICEQLDFKFKIDQKIAMNFIEGEGIYKSKFECIREVFQNALDATKIRLYDDIKSGKYDYVFEDKKISTDKLKFSSDIPEEIMRLYPIYINLTEDNEKKNFKLIIEDSGCGISLCDLKRIEKVGSSWNSDLDSYKKIKEMPGWMKPTGSFGIGLHSLFMITDRVCIKTKSDGECAYSIEFRSSKENGFISVSKNNKKKRVGTSISFEFKKELLNQLDLEMFDDSIKDFVLKKEKNLDFVDKSYENAKSRNRICTIIESYISNINKFKFVKSGILSDKENCCKKRKPIDKIEDSELQITMSIEEDNDNIYVIVKDNNYSSEIEFSLFNINKDDCKNQGYTKNIPELFKAFGLKKSDEYVYDNFGQVEIYFKNIYCMTEKMKSTSFLFNVKLNIIDGEAKSLLSVNREFFKETKILTKYLKRINEIIPKIIEELHKCLGKDKFTNQSYINKSIIELYYSALPKADNKPNYELYDENSYQCIRKMDDYNSNTKEAKLSDLLFSQRIIVTRTRDCAKEIIDLAKNEKINIIIDDINFKDFEDLSLKLRILGFYKVNYINNDTYIADKGNKSNLNKVYIDENKKNATKNYLYMLFPLNDTGWDDFEERFYVHSFEFENYAHKIETNTNYLTVKGNKIISPFTKKCKDMTCLKKQGSESINSEKVDLDLIVDELRKHCKFDELIDYVFKNNLERNVDKKSIEKSYKELINKIISI